MTRSKSASGCGPSLPTMRLAVPMPAQFTRTRAMPCLSRAAFMRDRGRVGIGDIAFYREPADLGGIALARVHVDVEQRDLGAMRGELLGGRGAQSGTSAGDEAA